MENSKETVIVGGARLPVGSFGRSLRDISTIDMGTTVVKETTKYADIEPSDIGETIVGQVGRITEYGFVARAAGLKAGLLESTCTYSVSRQCSSGLQAIADAVMEIQTGFANIVVAVGIENTSQLPYCVKDARWDARMGYRVFEGGVIDTLTQPLGPYHNGVITENVAEKHNITHQEQDQYVLESRLRTAAAIEADKSKGEVLPVGLKGRKGNITVFDTDEGPRASQITEKLKCLKPCFVKGGTITADNSSSLNDGIAAVVVMSREKTNVLGARPPLTIKGYTITGDDGAVMGYAPKSSSEKLAAKLGLDPKAIDMFEVDEAFASQAFAVWRDLGLDPDRANIYGGGIPTGHPIGIAGVILAVRVFYELQRIGKKDAVVNMCIGGGQKISMYFTKD